MDPTQGWLPAKAWTIVTNQTRTAVLMQLDLRRIPSDVKVMDEGFEGWLPRWQGV
jgi:hypothetical protein